MTDLIERELTLPAPPEAVWEALTDPDWLREWLADEAELQLRPGGDARFRIGAGHSDRLGRGGHPSGRGRRRPPGLLVGAGRRAGLPRRARTDPDR